MKKVFKEKTFWMAVICFVIAIAFVITGSILHPGLEKPLGKFEKSLNKHDKNGVASCFAPEEREDILMEMSFLDATDELGLTGQNSIHIIQAGTEEVPGEEGVTAVKVFMLNKVNGQYIDVESDTVYIEKVGGKKYIRQ